MLPLIFLKVELPLRYLPQAFFIGLPVERHFAGEHDEQDHAT